ncbi:hypothetical protein EDD85DRAFT_961982 [Armillaria nabsnona]|nr:hypothetical protein EDD85DRAFT_961982 [Armillaria nabsnona]
MSTQADIPSDLSNDEKAFMFQALDTQLNSTILYALLYGVYTGILAVALWNIFINKCWRIRRALVVVIILLHGLTTINVAANWSYICSEFLKNKESIWTVYLTVENWNQATVLTGDIASTMCTIITDLYMIWCCWVVWGWCWIVVLLPILSLIAATGKVSNLIYSLHVSHLLFSVKTH